MITKGSTARGNLIQGIRELVKPDLAVLAKTREVPVIKRLRDPHHRLARLVASGLKPSAAATQAGYSYGSLSILQKDPAFQELVSHYRGIVDENFAASQDAFYELATANMLKAERHIAEQIESREESGELLSIREALAVSRDAADRFGYGKKTTNVNVNLDFAAKLERAHKRSATVIETKALPGPAGGEPARAPAQAPPHRYQPRILRRA